MSFKDYLLAEDIEQAGKDLAMEIEATVKNIFPKSSIDATFSGNLMPSIRIEFALGSDKEFSHNIIRNDPVHHIFSVMWDKNKLNALTLERLSGAIMVKPSEGSHLAMERHKIPFRKVAGDSKKIIAGVDRYFKKLKTEISKISNDIYDPQFDIKSKL